MEKTYEYYMKKCLKLALKGEGKVSPNPLVGCVVLDKNGNEIATGYHKKYGENHAERDALLKVTKKQTDGGTLFVNLEPCSHQGKTPPCTDIIIEKGIKTVVYSTDDLNPVASKGAEVLKKAGIKVIKGVLEDKSKELNEVFFKNMCEKEVFVALKTATTIDGKIATYCGNSKWITSEKARKYSKNLRKKYDAILTTSSTIIADNPEMISDKKIILDRTLKTLNKNYKIYNQGEIYIATDEKNKLPNVSENTKFITLPTKKGKLDLNILFEKLFDLKIMSVFIEAGGTLNGDIIENNLADKIYHFVAPKILNDNNGISAFNGNKKDKISMCKNYKITETKVLKPDILITYKRV